MVPAQAVRLTGTQHSVFVQTAPGVFEPREVRIGWQGPRQVLVSRGLEAGELVVSGNMLLLARMYRLAQEEARPAASAATAAVPPASGAGAGK